RSRSREGSGLPDAVELLRCVFIAAKGKEVARVVVVVPRGAPAAREPALEGGDGAGGAATRRKRACHGKLECGTERGKRLVQCGNRGARLGGPRTSPHHFD